MPILNIVTSQTGQVGLAPKWVYIATNDTLATILTTGYLNKAVQNGATFREDDMALVSTKTSPSASTTQCAILEISYSPSTGWSLVTTGGPGSVVLPTTANHIAIYTNTNGELSEDAATAINAGNIQAGLSGTAGALSSFPTTAANGSLILAAVNAGGAFNTTISNGTMAQSCVYTIPDVTAATGQFLVKTAALVNGNLVQASGTAGVCVDSGVATTNLQLKTQVKAAATADIGGGGAGPISVAVAGLTASSIVVATVASSTNTVAVAKCIGTVTGFDVTFTADPGAACVLNYVAYIVSQ